MVVDWIENAALYTGLSRRLASALHALESNELNGLAPGRHDIEGDEIYASLQEYVTKPNEGGTWEAHRRYIDVHYIVKGTEAMAYANQCQLTVHKPYDEASDTLRLVGDGDIVTLHTGMFAIFYPHDAHIPRLAAGAPEPVSKIVLKVLLND